MKSSLLRARRLSAPGPGGAPERGARARPRASGGSRPLRPVRDGSATSPTRLLSLAGPAWHIAPMVRFSQVGLRYPDPARGTAWERETLRDLSFTLPQGSFTWLTGPSGAGKTSLLRMMQLALRPTRGEVEVLGVPLSRARREDLPKLRRRIGAVFQEFRLLPYLTAFDNVALPLRLAGRAEASLRPDVAEMLRWVGLEGREDALPQQLSGGEQQRVAIARAVVTRPALLVADEPTGNLDAVQARRLILLLAEMNRLGATVMVATHQQELIAQHPGHVLHLEAGRIVSLTPWPYAAAEEEAPAEAPLPDGPLPEGFAPDLAVPEEEAGAGWVEEVSEEEPGEAAPPPPEAHPDHAPYPAPPPARRTIWPSARPPLPPGDPGDG